MRLGLTTEGAETPVRAARKEACERIRFAQLGRNSPTLDGRQMICGRGVDEWHEVRLPPSSFRAPRSGFPRFQWLTDLSTAPRIKCAPSPDRGIDNSALSAQMDLTLFGVFRHKCGSVQVFEVPNLVRRCYAYAEFGEIRSGYDARAVDCAMASHGLEICARATPESYFAKVFSEGHMRQSSTESTVA